MITATDSGDNTDADMYMYVESMNIHSLFGSKLSQYCVSFITMDVNLLVDNRDGGLFMSHLHHLSDYLFLALVMCMTILYT